MTSESDTQSPNPAQKAGETQLRELFGSLPSLSEEMIAALGEVARPVDYADGALVMAEGERSDHLFAVVSGKVTVFRAAHGREEEQQLVTLGPGELLGEMALIDGAPRSLSARAAGDCRLLQVRPEDLARLTEGKNLLTELKAGLGAAVVRRMRNLTDRHVEALERELDAIRDQQQFGKFFLYTMTVMAIGLVTNNLILKHLVNITPNSLEFAWVFAVILVMPSIGIVWAMRIPLHELGVTTTGMRASLFEAGVISSVMVLFTLALVGMGVLPGTDANPFDPIPVIAYTLHSFLQELFARGFFQSSLKRFLNDRRGAKSVVFTSILFGLFHIHFGLAAVAVTAVGGLIFGAFYLRHPNLAGVTLLHFFVGICAFNSGLL